MDPHAEYNQERKKIKLNKESFIVSIFNAKCQKREDLIEKKRSRAILKKIIRKYSIPLEK